MDKRESFIEANLAPELYFLIAKFLSGGPLKDIAKALVDELEKRKALPKRLDWLGNEHEQTFSELEAKFQHISSSHLLQICARLGPILEKELSPSIPGLYSLLGSGRQSLLRTSNTVFHSRTLLDYCTRIHGSSLPDSTVTKPIHNIRNVLFGREYGGSVHRKLLVPTSLYVKTKLLRRTVGHLSSVYCVLFDRTGRYIITGADDLLVKIWSSMDGRLLATLRGASAEITDIAINLDNTMLAAGSIDRILRVWDLQTASPIAVLSGHTGMITSVNFCPSPRTDLKYLVTTSTDGSIAFWQYSTPRGQKITFAPKPTQYHEKIRPGQAQMMCTSFSPGGMFLAAGSADHHVRVYLMCEDGPKRILESEAYTDAVDSVQWSHRGLRFISGSKDGTAHIWTFESQQWKSVKLSMSERLPSCPEPEEGKKLKVTMVAWDYSDNYVITAANDFTIKIWNSKTAKLHCVLRGHQDELYVLESNPKDMHVLLSAGHDGQVFLWDIERGVSVARFINDIDGQGHGGVFDAKWSPDGTMIAATDSHGHLLIFGLGYGPDKYQILPTELFFHTDYRPLVRDASHHVVDEQTQIVPHLMPPPFLVDAYGSPHPAHYQRFVPGRENCSSEQLIPNVAVAPDGVLIEDNVPQNNNNSGNYSHIDRLIAALANRQGVSGGGGVGGGAVSANINGVNHSELDRRIELLANRQGQDHLDRPSTSRESGGLSGNILGRNPNPLVARRQSEVNGLPPTPRPGITWGRPPSEQQQQTPPAPSPIKYIRRVYVRPMKYAQLQNLKQTVYSAGQYEMQEYKREMRRRPIMINTGSAAAGAATLQTGSSGRSRLNGNTGSRAGASGRPGRRRGQGNQPRPAYRTRAVRDAEESREPAAPPEEEEEEEESSATSGDTSYSNVEENLEDSSDSDSESSDYSDWVADTPGPNLEPPTRAKRKPLSRRRTFSDDSSEDDTPEQATTSAAAAAAKANNRRRDKRAAIPPKTPNGEIPELYRPAEWLSEVVPRKAPYYPQMGDEVVYIRQGHQRYLDAVRQKKFYKLTHSSEPWNFRTLRDHELVRVIGIKYEIRPPRLCCLKLAMIDEDGNMTGSNFKIKYHDIPDVLDFLVLRQTFDLAVQRNWSIGDRFRCMIDDGWWMGQIESRHALSSEFPDSYFMCFRVRWDNGEYEYMSPWDMEPIDENRLPDEVGGAVPVLPEEIRATLYQPKSEEWHRGDRDGSCRRIINGLEQVMRLSIAEHFLAPVDLNIYPDYAYFIEYPIDLTTIKSRFENHFYRRITSAQFDVRYLATNAEKYNRRHTNIVKQARIITDLCLRIIREPNDIDVAAVYHQLVDVYHSSETENDDSDSIVPSTSTGPTTSAAARQSISSTRRSTRARSDGDWRVDCRQLLDLMWQRPDSEPFREPVDSIEFPDYLEIIATPMDLRTVKEDLLGGNYDDPLDFAKDVRLIFQNSKNYNTNKRSRIYSMTLRLSALFESQIKTVISNWKAARRRANKAKAQLSRRSGGSGGATSSSPNKTRTPTKPKTRRNQQQNSRSNRRLLTSGDEDDEAPGPSQRRGAGAGGAIRNGLARNAVVASTSGSNRVTSSSQSTRRRMGVNNDQPTVAQRSSRRRRRAKNSQTDQDGDDDDVDDDDEEEADEVNVIDNASVTSSESLDESADSDEEEEDDSSAASSDDDNDDDDDDHHRKRRGGKRAGGHSSNDEVDSEESYKPVNQRGGRRRRGSNKSVKHRKTMREKQQRKPQTVKRKRHSDDDGDDDDDEEYDHTRNKRNGRGRAKKGPRGKPKMEGVAPSRRQRRGLQSSEEEHHATASTSQMDESTQDTVTHTPKKRGRPPTKDSQNNGGITAATATYDGPSTSLAVTAVQQSPRFTRYQLHNSALPGNNGTRRNAAENDHSYHLPVRNGRIAESDTDSREVAARPTRASVKRAIMDWGRGSDIDESEEAEEILPTPTPTKTSSNGNSNVAVVGSSSSSSSLRRDLNGPSSSRTGVPSISTNNAGVGMRQLRTNRNTVVEPPDDSDADDSDNEPLATSQGGMGKPQTRPQAGRLATAPRPHPLHLQRNRALPSSATISSSSSIITHMTRSHATSTTSNVATSSIAEQTTPATSQLAEHDHNYLGASEGPSTSAAASMRNSRRVLSRHQRNADELDTSLDPMNDPLENPNILNSRLRRGVPSSTTSARNGNNVVEVRRGRSRYSQEISQTEETNDEVEGDDSGGSDEGTDGGSRTQSGDVVGDDDEDDDGDARATDSEDNQPLTSYVSGSNTRGGGGGGVGGTRARENHDSETRMRGRRQRKRRHSENSSFVYDDEMYNDDDDYEVKNTRRRHRSTQKKKQKPSRRQQRNRRYHDNDGDDDDDDDGHHNDDNESSGGEAAYSTRRKRTQRSNQKRPRYNEQSEDDGGEQQQQQQHQAPAGSNNYSTTSHRKRRKRDDATDSTGGGGEETAITASMRKKVTNVDHHDGEDNDDDDDDDDADDTDEGSEGQLVSVSSRGRVRKITAKVRKFLKE